MRFSNVLAASLVAAPLVAAHGEGGPRIFGLGKEKMRVRGGPMGSIKRVPQQPHRLAARQGGLEGRCGPDAGGASCDAGYCCSPAGWCGIGPEFCMAPDCLLDYGPSCDANLVPSGGSTKEIPRPQLNPAIEYGGYGIYACRNPGDVAITYDDGPYIYTDSVMDQFAEYGMKATFFITGININKGSIDNPALPWADMIRRMYAEGHQIASHTWSHQNLDSISSTQRYDQMIRNEMAFANILGKFPTYMRPPYSACITDPCEKDMADMGYVVTYFDLDTDDYNNEEPEKIQNAKDIFADRLEGSNPANDDFLVIGHDIHDQTANNLTRFMLDMLVAKGYRGVTVGECLGDPEANWYRDASSGRVPTSGPPAIPTATPTIPATSSVAFPTPTGISTDGTCGNKLGFSCVGAGFGDCCSPAGWCGSTTDHCGTGCQSGFGKCDSDSSSSSSASATITSSASSSSSTEVSSSASSTIASSTPSSTTAVPTATPSAKVSIDGTCGGDAGYTCVGSTFGDCCSSYGWCGSSEVHCDATCNPLFGNCPGSSSSVISSVAASSAVSSAVSSAASSVVASSVAASSSSSSSSSAAPSSSPVAKVSTDGTCGGASGFTCAGSTYGDCCSVYGWCGASETHCSTGCNPLFGNCPGSSSAVVPSSVAPTSSAPVSSVAPSSAAPVTRTSTVVASSIRAASSTTSSAAAPTATKVSQDGSCGGTKGYTCRGASEGDCCSQYGWCGATSGHCMAGCNPLFGRCGQNYVKPASRPNRGGRR